MKIIYTLLAVTVFACSCALRQLHIPFPADPGAERLGGKAFYDSVKQMNWKDRELVAREQLMGGNMPEFLMRFVPVRVSVVDSISGKSIRAVYFVSPDYVSIGTNDDWARIPLSPMLAQPLADTLHCFLPTRKMVDDIYRQAKVKLEPIPLYAFRDSSLIMYHHHLIIEGQRKGKKGLIAGIKKDLVISDKLTRSGKADREAIYGWHWLSGKPIQPLYTGHVNWWVDYSHGTRLVFRTIIVNGKKMDYIDVMKDTLLRKLLCDEEFCDVYRY